MICLQQTRAHLPIAAVMFDDHTNDATILYTAHHPFTSPPLDNTHSALIPTHSTGDMVFVKNNNTESYKKSFHPTYFAIGNFYYYFFFFLSRRFVAEERRGNKIVFYALSQTNICRWNNIDAAILTNKSIWTTAIVLCDAVDAWTTVLAWIRVAFIPIRLALHTGVSIDAITRICTVDENGNRERKIEWDILYIMMRMGECSFRGKKKMIIGE